MQAPCINIVSDVSLYARVGFNITPLHGFVAFDLMFATGYILRFASALVRVWRWIVVDEWI